MNEIICFLFRNVGQACYVINSLEMQRAAGTEARINDSRAAKRKTHIDTFIALQLNKERL